MLSTEELKKVNEIIEIIYRSKNMKELRIEFLKKLSKLIKFSFSEFNMSLVHSENVPKLVDPVVFSKYDKEFEERFEYLYESKYYKMDYVNWVFLNPESLVYRESDLLSAEIKNQNPFYQEYLMEFGLIYVMGITIASSGKFLGATTFYKTAQVGDFNEKDLYIANLLMPHLTIRFNMDQSNLRQKNKNASSFLKYQYAITSREIEIMGYMLYGYTNQEISEKLNISKNTVKKHTANIFEKLNVTGRPQLVRFIIKNMLIHIWDDETLGNFG